MLTPAEHVARQEHLSSAEFVASLPRRTAHALYGALTASIEAKMPVTAAEAMLYDEEALSPRSTAAGLRHARKLGLVAFDGRYWWTDAAQDIKYALEDRYLRETA